MFLPHLAASKLLWASFMVAWQCPWLLLELGLSSHPLDAALTVGHITPMLGQFSFMVTCSAL
jgi:hypothetical protein